MEKNIFSIHLLNLIIIHFDLNEKNYNQDNLVDDTLLQHMI